VKCKALILDLDGTVYLDAKPVKDIISRLNHFFSDSGEIIFLTNNTSVSKTLYVSKLLSMGLEFVSKDNILTPIDAFLEYSKKTKVKSCFYLLPEEVISFLHENQGPVMNQRNPDIVLVGFDRELTYLKLQKACGFINQGSDYHITHIDLACPSLNGPIPDCGSIARLIEATTNKTWGYDFGKPSFQLGYLIEKKLEQLNIDVKEAVLIGDRYYTDIALGNNIGTVTCHVKTGEKFVLSSSDPKNYQPTYEYDDICEFMSDFFDKPN
jgi:4-nitrophenyl phosphatase